MQNSPIPQLTTVPTRLTKTTDTISSSTLTEAFGPSSLGILLVKDLDSRFHTLRREVLSSASQLAALPAAELERLTLPEAKYLVGWSCGKETLRSGRFDTLKGSFYVNCSFYRDAELQSARASVPLPAAEPGLLPSETFAEYTTDNVWPEREMDGVAFRTRMQDLCRGIIDTAALVARACDRFGRGNIHGYQDGYLERVVRSSLTTKARLLHYFPGANDDDDDDHDDDDDDWCATHVDHGCLTGLTSAMFVDAAGREIANPDPQAGLYIRSRTGHVVQVNIPPDCLAFQTGEALQVLTQGQFRAVPHFVKGVGKGVRGGVARNTLAVFTQPNLHEMVDGQSTFGEFARGVVQRTY